MVENPELRGEFLFQCEVARRELTTSDTRILARLADNLYSMVYNDPERKRGFLALISDVR